MLFSRRISPSCSYCRYGAAIGEGEVACSKRGIMPAEGSCRKFSYDPLKRVPEKPPRLPESPLSKELADDAAGPGE